MERILAILAEEAEYIRELASYLSSRAEFIFKPVVFTDRDSFKKYDSENHVDMLLCSPKMVEGGTEFRAENVCVLSECVTVSEGALFPEIFKYQSSEQIMKDIIDYYGKRKVIEAKGSKEISAGHRTICVCSPIGGSYSSTYALALADYYSRGGRTLFLSFDPFFLFPGEVKKYTDKNLTDVLYFLQIYAGSPQNFVEKISLHRGNLDYVSGVSHWFDIAEMTPGHMRALLTSLCEGDKYESIIFDIGSLGSAGIELLAGCKYVYVPMKKGVRHEATLNEWKRQLCFSGQNDIVDKVVIKNIPYDENLNGEYRFENLLKGTLGQYINETEGLGYLK